MNSNEGDIRGGLWTVHDCAAYLNITAATWRVDVIDTWRAFCSALGHMHAWPGTTGYRRSAQRIGAQS